MSVNPIDLSPYGIHVDDVIHNATPARLYEYAIIDSHAAIAATGALATRSGDKTGRSPKDKRIVDDPASSGDIWWGDINIRMTEHQFLIDRQRAVDYLNTRKRIFVFDGFAGWDPTYQLRVRVIAESAYHALFMHNMLIRPDAQQLAQFSDPTCRCQCRFVSCEPLHIPYDQHDQHRPVVRAWRDGDSRYPVCRRNEKRCVHRHELPNAQTQCAQYAL